MTQLPLPLELRPALGRDDLVVAAANAEAVAWVDRWPDWPGHALAIFGPPSCGKSHLAHVFAAKSSAVVIKAAELVERYELAHTSNAVILEDGPVVGEAGERQLFHLINWCRERRGSLLITGEQPPSQWRVGIPDLSSRLAAMPAIGILPPDDQLLAAVMLKMFADRQMRLEPRVADYILPRTGRSFAALASLVEAVDQASLSRKRPVGMKLVREILENPVSNLS